MRLIIFLVIYAGIVYAKQVPIVINTWAFTDSTQAAWNLLKRGGDAIDAVEIGCMTCEKLQCDGTVGFGGSPDENGETTLDALLFDGSTMNMGAVGALRRVKDVISVAKHVLINTGHSIVVGSQATEFAKRMGFTEEDLTTDRSKKIWTDWKNNRCQPNAWLAVLPDSNTTCGPYRPVQENDVYYNHWTHNYPQRRTREHFQRHSFSTNNHDTIGMIAIDANGKIVAGTSTNGMSHKIPGRVGDSPIPGAGGYADSKFGAASATGDGDIMMRFLPSFLAVEELRRGSTPSQAAWTAINRIKEYYPSFFGGIIVVNKQGEYGAACNGMDSFPFSVASQANEKVTVKRVTCK